MNLSGLAFRCLQTMLTVLTMLAFNLECKKHFHKTRGQDIRSPPKFSACKKSLLSIVKFIIVLNTLEVLLMIGHLLNAFNFIWICLRFLGDRRS